MRPLFEWMPILLIFLSSALTMRMWSEERRTGTLEYVLTLPIPLWCNSCWANFRPASSSLLLALVITLPLPFTGAANIGNLDWGPVLAAYLATLLMGAAYISHRPVRVRAERQPHRQPDRMRWRYAAILYLLGSQA